jgi:hypothetical protein
LSLTGGCNIEDISQLLKENPEIHMSIGKRQVGIDEFVKLMSTPVQHASVCVTGVSRVDHISRVTSDRVWVNDYNNIILTDTTGITIHRVTDLAQWYIGGLHTVNSFGELIYIDNKLNINKLSLENKTLTSVLWVTSEWLPRCVYCSPTTGDLIVGIWETVTETGIVITYSNTGQQTLTIQHDNNGQTLYCQPMYITENTNDDIIVADYSEHKAGAVVVTDCKGRHRFSYTGPPLGSPLYPLGICTDALSHILVCDLNSDTVHMIDKDGHFLSLLLTKQHGIYRPYSLNYDERTHLLWVGSHETNKVCVYRYRLRRYSLTGKY